MALYDVNHELMRLKEHFDSNRTKFSQCRVCTLYATDVNVIDTCSDCITLFKSRLEPGSKNLGSCNLGSGDARSGDARSEETKSNSDRIDFIKFIQTQLSHNEIKNKIDKKLEFYNSMPIRHYLDKSDTIPEINSRLSLFMILDLHNKLNQYNSIA
jgi:hypothetical protein